MAERLVKDMLGPGWKVRNAGLDLSQVNPRAAKVMQEIGIGKSKSFLNSSIMRVFFLLGSMDVVNFASK